MLRGAARAGLGNFCQPSDFDLDLQLRNWRQLDEAIARVGAKLKRESLKEPITLCIGVNTTTLVSK